MREGDDRLEMARSGELAHRWELPRRKQKAPAVQQHQRVAEVQASHGEVPTPVVDDDEIQLVDYEDEWDGGQ